MKKAILAFGLFGALMAQAMLLDLQDTREFENLINEAEVPVVVQFHAYWCGPCKNLIKTMNKIAPSYSDDEVILAKVDAYVNDDLGKYLQGGYPTVRSFYNGKLLKKSFVGSQSESKVRRFIDSVIADPREELFFSVGPHSLID